MDSLDCSTADPSNRSDSSTCLRSVMSLAMPVMRMTAPAGVAREAGVKLKLGLNAYSFDKALRDGSMTLTDAVHFCAQHGVDALDPTGYYFPGYPKVPADDYIYNLKRAAFVNGVAPQVGEAAER